MERISHKIQLWTVDNFASDQECDQIIKEAYLKGFQPSSVQSDIHTDAEPKEGIGAMKTVARNSYTSFIGQSQVGDKLIQKATKILENMNVKFSSVEGLQVQRYKPNEHYNPHYDSFENKTSSDQRSWTVMIYLGSGSDKVPLEGGETFFPKLDLRITPKKGKAVIWNNLDSRFCRKQKTLHMGEDVIKGTKYVVTMWFRAMPENICPIMESFQSHNPVPTFNPFLLGFICLLFLLFIWYMYRVGF